MPKLRIISGDLKGRYVITGDDIDFRPTQERVRESVAEIIKRKVPGASVADLCSGSGAMGFEMLSRGAARADFVEIGGRVADRIADNAKQLGVDGRVRVVRDDVRWFAGTAVGRYGIIYYDPPYDVAELRGLVPKLLSLLTGEGVLVYERRRLRHEKKAADTGGKINIVDARIYSDTVVEFYNGEEKNADSAIPGDV